MKSIDDIDWAGVDFIDFGSGIGGSLASAESRIGGVGVGIEQRPNKVEQARANGRNVVLGDIFALPEDVTVRYVTIDNVLEHLPSMAHVERALGSAAGVAQEFIYIRHPSFEDESYLRQLGLKQYWADWTDHATHILLADFAKMCHRLGAAGWLLHPVQVAQHSDDPTIIPLESAPDQHQYDAVLHGPKPRVTFDRPVYYAWDLVILLNPRGRLRLEYVEDPDRSDRRPRIIIDREGDS